MRYEPVWALRVGAVIMLAQLVWLFGWVGFSDWTVLGR